MNVAAAITLYGCAAAIGLAMVVVFAARAIAKLAGTTQERPR